MASNSEWLDTMIEFAGDAPRVDGVEIARLKQCALEIAALREILAVVHTGFATRALADALITVEGGYQIEAGVYSVSRLIEMVIDLSITNGFDPVEYEPGDVVTPTSSAAH